MVLQLEGCVEEAFDGVEAELSAWSCCDDIAAMCGPGEL